MSDPSPAAPAGPPYPRRFGWPMRLFLGLLLFDLVFRSFSVCFPWIDWADELGMRRLPPRLATEAELRRRQLFGLEASRTADARESLAGVVQFLDPRPDEEVRARLTGPGPRLKYALAWLSSRLDWVEDVLGFNEEWPMFSPNVSRVKSVARARLTYADGSECEVRGRGDPEDLTRYSHWNEEKILDHELKVKEGRDDECFGYCNLLAHRHPTSPSGAPLRTIRLFTVTYYFPQPGEDARARLAEQSGPPPDQRGPDFYEFDAQTRIGRSL